MKRIERMAMELVERATHPEGDLGLRRAMKAAYEAGFRAAREMAAEWIQERTQHANLFVPGFVPERIRELGEDEVGG